MQMDSLQSRLDLQRYRPVKEGGGVIGYRNKGIFRIIGCCSKAVQSRKSDEA